MRNIRQVWWYRNIVLCFDLLSRNDEKVSDNYLIDRQTDKIDRRTDGQTDSQRKSQRERERERERDRQRCGPESEPQQHPQEQQSPTTSPQTCKKAQGTPRENIQKTTAVSHAETIPANIWASSPSPHILTFSESGQTKAPPAYPLPPWYTAGPWQPQLYSDCEQKTHNSTSASHNNRAKRHPSDAQPHLLTPTVIGQTYRQTDRQTDRSDKLCLKLFNINIILITD